MDAFARAAGVIALALTASSIALGCSESRVSAAKALDDTDAVFRGVITKYLPDSTDDETGIAIKIAVFRVSRVWKGRVGRSVKITTQPGFRMGCRPEIKLLPIGSDVVIFAGKVEGEQYMDGYWYAVPAGDIEYLKELGPGKPPGRSDYSPREH